MQIFYVILLASSFIFLLRKQGVRDKVKRDSHGHDQSRAVLEQLEECLHVVPVNPNRMQSVQVKIQWAHKPMEYR